ncbi:hypothetical protein K2Z84_34635 [Candidatus Binatia bacterium]|nr:hypothetical protein [Candidatus Binatia bacterium]
MRPRRAPGIRVRWGSWIGRAIGALGAAIVVGALAAAARADTAGEDAGAPVDAATTLRRPTLAEEFADPLTTLPQLFVQDAFTPVSYGTEGRANRVIVRAIVPRIPRLSLLPFVQLVRPSVQLVTVPTSAGRGTRTAFGDFQLFDLAVLPWPDHSTGLYMGAGPLLIFPTATAEQAGQGAWQAGPACAALYKGLPGVLIGGLVQNPISFAYTARDRPAVSTLIVQPIALAYLGNGFYVKSADASWTMGWHQGTATVIPVSFGVGYVHLREGEPPINLFVSGEWTAYRQLAPVAPQTTVRFGVTVAFPDFRPW